MSQTSATYLTCTDGRGFDTSTSIGGGVGGSFKVIANASIKAAYSKSSKEDTKVALQIVQDRMTIAQQEGSGAEASQAGSFAPQADQDLRSFEQQQVARTPHIKLSRSSAAIGESVTVSGGPFTPNETVDIHVHATLVKQVQVDGAGMFRSTVVIPQGSPGPDFQTTISVSGESSARTGEAPFHTR